MTRRDHDVDPLPGDEPEPGPVPGLSPGKRALIDSVAGAGPPPVKTPGKRTLSERLGPRLTAALPAPLMAPVLARDAWPGAPTPGRLPSAVTRLLGSDGGAPLPDAPRWSRMVGADVSAARILTGPGAEEAADSVGARAFTLGDRVVFGAGQYAPGSADGDRLLRHELTHVVQQGARRVTSFEGIGVTTPADDAEHEARDAADGGVVSAAPQAPVIARDQVAAMEADAYVVKHAAQLTRSLGNILPRLLAHTVRRSSSLYTTWQPGAVDKLAETLTSALGGDPLGPLRAWLAPLDLDLVINRGRAVSDSEVVRDRVVGYGSSEWILSVGEEVASVVEQRVRESLDRIVPRYLRAKARAAAADPSRRAEPDPTTIVPSHPVDRSVAAALCTGSVVAVDLDKYAVDHTDLSEPASAANLEVTLLPMVEAHPHTNSQYSDPDAWDAHVAAFGRRPQPVWVRASSATATSEEVARVLFGNPAQAYRLIAAPPLFSFDVRAMPWLLPKYQLQLGDDPVVKQIWAWHQIDDRGRQGYPAPNDHFGPWTMTVRRVDLEVGFVGGDPLAGLDGGARDEAALASAGPQQGPPRSREAVLADMQRSAELLDGILELARRFDDRGQAVALGFEEAIIGQVERLHARRLPGRDTPDADVQRWGTHAAEQSAVLATIYAGFLSVADTAQEQAKALDAQNPPELIDMGRTARVPIVRLVEAFVSAAACSDMPSLARTRLAHASALIEQYTLDIIELVLQEVLSTLKSVNSKGGHGSHASLNLIDESYFREELATLRIMIRNGDPAAPELIRALWEKVQNLQIDSTLIANMDSLHEAWKAMDDMADTFGVWGSVDDTLRDLMKESKDYRGQWEAIYSDWGKVRDQQGTDAEAAKKLIRERMAALSSAMAQSKYFDRMDRAMSNASFTATLARVAGLLVIVIATMGAGLVVEGLLGAGGLGLGVTVVVTAQVIAEAATFTALHTLMFEQHPTLQGVAVEFVYNVVLFGAMRWVSGALEASKLGKYLGSVDPRMLKAGQHTASGLILTTGTLARAQVESLLDKGRTLTREEAGKITLETVASYVALLLLGRGAQEFLAPLKNVGGKLGSKIKAAQLARQRVADLAEAIKVSKNIEEVPELLKRDRESLQKDIEALEELKRTAAEDPALLRRAGLDDADIAALTESLPGGLDKLKLGMLMGEAQHMAGDLYTVPRTHILEHVARHRQLGGEVKKTSGGQVEDLPVYEIEYADGTRFRIHERPPEPGDPVPGSQDARGGAGGTVTDGPPAPAETPSLRPIDTSKLSETQQATTRWMNHAMETDPRAAELMKSAEFREAYARWMEMPNRIEPEGAGFKVNYPDGISKEAREGIDRVVKGGGLTLATRGMEVTEALAREFPELRTVNPDSAQWQTARPQLIQRFGIEAVARYEATLAGRPGQPERADLDARVDSVLADGALEAFRAAFPGTEIYLTGSITQTSKGIEAVKDVDVILVAKEPLSVGERIAVEKRAQSMRMPTSQSFRDALRMAGKPVLETLEIDVKVMTPEEHAGWVMQPPAKGRTPMVDLRVDDLPPAPTSGPGRLTGPPGGYADPGASFSGADLHNHVMGVPSTGYFVQKIGGGRAVELLNRAFELGKGSKKFQADAPDLWVRLQQGKSRVDQMRAEGARPDQVEAKASEIMDGMLSTTADNPFYKTYDVRDLLIEGAIDVPSGGGGGPPPYRNYAKDAMRMLAQEGVAYSEQSVSIKKLLQRFPEKMMQDIAAELVAEGAITDMRFLAMLKTQALAKGDARTQGGEGQAKPEDVQKEFDTNLDQLYDTRTGKGVLMRGDVRGVDFAGPEAGSFTSAGMQNFRAAYLRVQMAGRARNVTMQLRPHVGEGDASTDPMHAKTARDNLQALLDAIRGLKAEGLYTGDGRADGVEIRFGHATHASEAQIRAMGELGITVEANISSNLATGSIASPDQHGLLYNLYYNVRTVLATDAQGVMGTTLPQEHAQAAKMIEQFRSGRTSLLIEGKSKTFNDITDPAIRERFDIKQLERWSRDYESSVLDSDVRDNTSDFGSDGSRLKLGKKLGSGGEKDVYEVKGRDDLVAGVAREHVTAQRLHDESAKLRQLADMGLPVVEIVGIINHNGRPTVLMRRYAEGSKKIVRTVGRTVKIVGESNLLNERSISDLQQIKELLVQLPVKVDDLQFLVGDGGEIVIADPVNVTPNEKPSPRSLATINKLIVAAERAIARRNEGDR